MENKSEELSVCQVIDFIEDDELFSCRELVNHKIIYKGMGIEGFSCQRHYEFFRNEVEKNGMSEMIEFVEINNDKQGLI
jgi:hypothetical protein